MSNKLRANDVLLEFNTGTTLAPVWKSVACVTANDLDSASDEIEASSKCGIDKIPGDVSWSVTFEGFYDLDPALDQISGQDLIAMRQAKTFTNWRMRNAGNTYYRAGYAYLNDYSESAPYNDIVKLSGGLSIQGALIIVAPTT